MTRDIGNDLRKHHGVWEQNPHYQAGNEVKGAREAAVQGSGPVLRLFTGAELGLGTHGGKFISRHNVRSI